MRRQPREPTVAIAVSISLALLAPTFAARPASGARLELGEDAYLDAKAFVQGWVQSGDATSPDGNNWAADVYLRRMRVLLSGQVHKNVRFFYGTVQSNFGKAGSYSTPLTSADAWLEWYLNDRFMLDVGLLMVPFVHSFRQGGARIHGVDWHTALRKFPVTSHYLGRDTGVGARGFLLDDHFGYVVHLTQGTRAGDGMPRVTARAMYNLFDADKSFHYAGTYLGKKRIVSIGLALDAQVDGGITATGKTADYVAVGGDVVVDYPVGDNGVVVQLNVAHYKHSIGTKPGKTCTLSDAANTCTAVNGLTVLFEAGYRIGKVEPLVGLDWFRPKGSSGLDGDYGRSLVGVNYWLKGHVASLKLQHTYEKAVGENLGQGAHGVLLQGQVLLK